MILFTFLVQTTCFSVAQKGRYDSHKPIDLANTVISSSGNLEHGVISNIKIEKNSSLVLYFPHPIQREGRIMIFAYLS